MIFAKFVFSYLFYHCYIIIISRSPAHHHTTITPPPHHHRHHQQQQHKIVRSLQLGLRFTRYLSVSSWKPYRIGLPSTLWTLSQFRAIFGTECCWSAPLLTVVRPVSDRFQDAATCSLTLETSDMKPFAISEYYLTQNLKFQWENKAKDDYPGARTDSIHINCKRVCNIVYHFENARFSYVLALEKKEW